MGNLLIRQATINDFEAIYKFVCGLENTVFDKEVIRKCYDTCLAGENNHYFIAEADGKAIGYVSCHGQVLMHHAGLVYEIEEFFVEEAYRSKGVGKEMLRVLEQKINTADYELLEVASNMRREAAHHFYTDNGFDKNTYKFMKLPQQKRIP
jgi:PhnO protein